jgi:hypothetical protein
MIWAALVLMIALVATGAWAWYGSRHLFAATSEAQQWRVLRRGAFLSAEVGVAILIMGVVAFVLTDYNWFVLAILWPLGSLHLGLLSLSFRRAQKRADRAGVSR